MPERFASAKPAHRSITVRIRKVPNGWWSATSPEFDGALASGRSLDALRKQIRKILTRIDRDLRRVTIVESIELRQDLADAIAAIRAEREQLELRRQASQQQLGQVVRRLRANGLGLRDAAELLGISTPYAHRLGQVKRGHPKTVHRPGRPRARAFQSIRQKM